MAGACADIRVLDCTTGAAGSLATMVLADFGADVVRIDAPGTPAVASTPANLLLHRGKRSIELDLDTADGRAELLRIVPGFDVVVEDWGPGVAEARGVGYDELAARQPALVLCALTGFGRAGPFADVPAVDALVMAKAGIFRDQPGWEQDGKRPVYRASPEGSYFAGMVAIEGILAALRARDLTGAGQRLDVNMLQAITCRQNPQIRSIRREGEPLPPDRANSTESVSDAINPLAHHRDPREVTPIGLLVECKDGRWIMHSLTEPHFFPAWIDVIGFNWIWEDERFKGAPQQFADVDTKAELVVLLQERMKEKTSDEWIDLYLANGNVCADVIQTTRDALHHAQVIAADDVVELVDPRVGPTTQVGPLAKIAGAPASITRPAPEPGEQTDEVLAEPVTPVVLPAPTGDRLAGPLDGITIVEAGYYYATPFATAMLAELGARVIKVEPLRGDPYRLLARGTADPVTALGQNNMVRAMAGKESISLNLKDERGRAILHQLIAGADVFVHSFRGTVPDALGIDEATLRAIKPDLVYQYAASYGSTGPYARQPAIDPVVAAFTGQTAYQTGEGNPPLRESGADPVAAAGHAAAMMLGLFARHRTGEGQSVESAMIVSNIYLNYEDALDYEGKAPRPPVDARQFGIGATQRVYQCASDARAGRAPYENADPRWVVLVATDDDAFARFCRAAGRDELLGDPRFATAAARAEHRTELEDVLGPLFLTRSAPEWEALLLAAGVGCVVADAMSHFAFLFEDEQAKAIDMMTKVEHPSLGGEYWRYAPLIAFSGTPARALPACDQGEHTRALLAELGLADAEVDQLQQDGVVSWEEQHALTKAW